MATEKDRLFPDIKRIGKVSSDGIFIYDHSAGQFLYVNQSLVNILEINRELLTAEPDLILNAIPRLDHEYLRIRFNELLEKESCEDVQIRIAANKIEKTLLLNAYLAGDSCVIAFVKDITKAKHHEDYLINFGARKDAILDMVSQNLSAPLNLSNFTIDLIEKAIREGKYYKLDAHIKLMREVTADCIRIIDEFLQEEHLQSPNVQLKVNRFDIVGKTAIVIDKLKVTNREKQFRIKTAFSHMVIAGDDLKYFQVVHNLLSNAIKFTPPNGVIEVALEDKEDSIEVRIKDNGIGIPEELKPFLFERKSRAGRPGLRGEISNGIGLYVVKELVTMMHGEIAVESREKVGTTFTFSLPKW